MKTVVVIALCFLSTQALADPFLVWRAKSDIGKSASDLGLSRRSLWCSEWLRKLTGSNDVDDRALSWLSHKKTSAQVGAIAVMRRGKNGGHVGVVVGFDAKRNPLIVSGNHLGAVREAIYPRQRISAYVNP